MTILLTDIWSIEEPRTYKLHFARWNQKVQPLEVFVRDRREWQGWQEHRPARNDFNRPFIFSLMQFYHEPDVWLFGGVFRVLARHPDRYEVELGEQGAGFIGRLKIHYPYRNRSTRVVMERHFSAFEVQEILPQQYRGRAFPGFDEIDLSFEELDALMHYDRSGWRAALENVKGIYMITDGRTGGRYIGAAYGDEGIWSRWRSYIETGHGGNVELRALLDNKGIEYFRENLRFALLEYRTMRTPDEVVLAREAFWKRILLTRRERGLNRN